MRNSARLPFNVLGCAILCVFLPTACLIGPPDELAPPERLPPRVMVDRAIPSILAPVQTPTPEPLVFRVPFVSEDLGELVVGRLFLNYNSGPTELDLGSGSAGFGSIDDTDREMIVKWSKNQTLPTGCYSITMTITHNDNYSPETLAPIDLTRTAFVTWWIVHSTEGPQFVNMDECFPPAFPAP